jgi:hypothetical protein
MANNKELERMINNVEKAITKVNTSIMMLSSPFEGKRNDRDPDTGLSKTFLKLKRRQSLLIEISTKLQKQHLDNTIKQRKEINK